MLGCWKTLSVVPVYVCLSLVWPVTHLGAGRFTSKFQKEVASMSHQKALQEVRALLEAVVANQSQGTHESVQQGIQEAIEVLDQAEQASNDTEVSLILELVLAIVKAIPALLNMIERFISGC